MAMYECYNCGVEGSAFPKVMLATNEIPAFPEHHESELEKKFDEFVKEFPAAYPYGNRYDYKKAWDAFHAWLGDKKMKWFCSKECAIEYLKKGVT